MFPGAIGIDVAKDIDRGIAALVAGILRILWREARTRCQKG